MKEKIMYLIIGVLIGAIVTTSGFLIYNKTTKNTKINERNMSNMGEPPSMDNSDNLNMSEPPTKPDGSKSQAPSGSNQSKASSSETSNS